MADLCDTDDRQCALCDRPRNRHLCDTYAVLVSDPAERLVHDLQLVENGVIAVGSCRACGHGVSCIIFARKCALLQHHI